MTAWRHARRLLHGPRRADTMVMPDTARRYTLEEVLAFPEDGNRYELVDGELLVTPAPVQPHEIVLVRLVGYLHEYLAPFAAVAQMFFSRGDVIWGPEEYVQPDLFVVPRSEGTGGSLQEAAPVSEAGRRDLLDRGRRCPTRRGVASARRAAGDRDGRAAVAGDPRRARAQNRPIPPLCSSAGLRGG